MWIGISTEENAKRCKPSREGWVTNRYPLRELGMTRSECERWLWDHYQVVAPKSACIGCPFHDDRYWLDLQQRSPEEFEDACRFDETIRHLPGVKASASCTAAASPCGRSTSPGPGESGARLAVGRRSCSTEARVSAPSEAWVLMSTAVHPLGGTLMSFISHQKRHIAQASLPINRSELVRPAPSPWQGSPGA